MDNPTFHETSEPNDVDTQVVETSHAETALDDDTEAPDVSVSAEQFEQMDADEEALSEDASDSDSKSLDQSDETQAEAGAADRIDSVDLESQTTNDVEHHQLDPAENPAPPSMPENRAVHDGDESEFADFFDGADVQSIQSEAEDAFDALFTPDIESQGGVPEVCKAKSAEEILPPDVMSVQLEPGAQFGTIAVDDSDIYEGRRTGGDDICGRRFRAD